MMFKEQATMGLAMALPFFAKGPSLRLNNYQCEIRSRGSQLKGHPLSPTENGGKAHTSVRIL